MVNANYVKVGRLVRIIRGPRENKCGVITAIIDANRVLVENPADEKMWRHVQNLKNIQPVKFTTSIKAGCSEKSLKASLETSKALEKYAKTSIAMRLAAKEALAKSTDFERYQLRVAKRSRAHWTRKLFTAADAKTPVSYAATTLKKLEKPHKKFADKHMKARHDRIKKHFAARKASSTKKGKTVSKAPVV
eukprot:Tbor_TRINITY_DN5294_c2_g5::TRINITY_DN5294_c2_g5_i2::g.16012::m.16012/K02875/RP-L14e, RPL14; large subunit ribosomal protein L14e